ncbi:MAG: hypothetical protein P8Y07_02510 [Gemmatimonadales bacterium]
MSIVSRCHGRVALGELPDDVRARLASIPGEWLEYDPESGAVLVRYVQPTEAPVLAATASELVRILDEIPYDLQTRIPGGDLFVRTEESEQLIRLRVTAGGALHIRWAHPGYDGALQRPYSDGHEIAIESFEQRLNGSIELGADDPQAAASELQDLADTFEGLYPEGDFRAEADASAGTVRVALSEVNLDDVLLIERGLLPNGGAGGDPGVGARDRRQRDQTGRCRVRPQWRLPLADRRKDGPGRSVRRLHR